MRDLDGRYGRCADATIQAGLTDLFGALKATARASATDYHLEDLDVATLEIEAEGDIESLVVSARSTGRLVKPFDVDTTAMVRSGGPIELRRLKGSYGEIAFELQRPATIAWTGPDYAVSSMELAIGDGRVVLSGRLDGDELAGLVEVTQLPLRVLQSLGAPPLDGLASGRIDLAGTTWAPRLAAKLDVTDMRSSEAAYRDLAPATLSADARLEGGRLDGTLHVAQGDGDGTLDATFGIPMTLSFSPAALVVPSEGAIEATVNADSRMDALSTLLVPERYELRGQLAATLRATGTIEAPDIEGHFSLHDGAYRDSTTNTAVSGIEAGATLALKDGVLSIQDVAASTGRTELSGRATVDLGAQPWALEHVGRFDGALTARAELADLGPLLIHEGHRVEGRVVLDLSGSGTPDTPRFDGSLRVEAVTYQLDGAGNVAENLDAKAVFALRDGVLEVSEFAATSAAGTASGSARIGAGSWPWELAPERLVEAKLVADVRLQEAMARLFADEQRVTGRFEADVAVTGTSDQPTITGWLRLRDGTYESFRTGTRLRDVTADVVPGRSRLTLAQLHATDGDKGSIAGTGWLDLVPGKAFPFQLDLALNDAVLVRADYLTGPVAGHVTLSGSADDIRLKGQLTTGPIDVQLPERVVPELAELNVIEINVPEGEAPTTPALRAPVPPIRLDVDVRLPKRVFVRGHGLDSEWEGKLRVTGSAEQPIITGRLTLTRGRFDLADRSFTLTEGTILFGGESPPAPILSIRAEAVAGGITAVIELSGPATSPTLALSSVPA
ncbi:MAG TPA: translocation/assembly module TamB domain-containing protein, partial [Acidimicrobiia bacterium]|nr:translocation/assembly module TamB domain-containing protein [Acidimicrobiia bacterium]